MAKWRNKVVERRSQVTEGNQTPEFNIAPESETPKPVKRPKKRNWRQELRKEIEEQPAIAPVQEVEIQEVQKEEAINNNNNFDPKKTYLVVGGKIKEISSKSKYLLDMLIIEED